MSGILRVAGIFRAGSGTACPLYMITKDFPLIRGKSFAGGKSFTIMGVYWVG
jgi:hypothetical protein